MSAEETVSDPVFVLFGATGGIASEVARQITREIAGARLVLAARREDALESLANELDMPGRVRHQVVDARNLEEVAGVMDVAHESFGRIDGVANCVGSLFLKPAHLTAEEEWDEVMNTNLKSAFAVVRAAAPKMSKQRHGSIVLCASAAARHGFANHEAIGAAKAGVIGLTLSAAASYASRGIRVNAVAPGLVETPMTEKLFANPASAEASQNLHALGRLGRPEDVADAITWLLHPRRSWVTGQVLGADGGLASVRSRR